MYLITHGQMDCLLDADSVQAPNVSTCPSLLLRLLKQLNRSQNLKIPVCHQDTAGAGLTVSTSIGP